MGIIEPLIVFPKNDRYEVIAGHRRRYAAELARLAEVPCHVHKVGPEQVEMMKIHENLYRREVRPSDEMQHFKYIMKRLNISPTKLAQLIGKSDVYVSERLAIGDYEPELKEDSSLSIQAFDVTTGEIVSLLVPPSCFERDDGSD